MAINSNPDVIEQQPAGGNVMEPQSGTYGEKAELARLQQELPTSGAPAEPTQPTPPQVQPRRQPGPDNGLPRGLLAPTRRPEVPASTPPQGPVDPYAGVVQAQQRRVRYLEILSSSPDATPEVREWARILLRKLSDVAGQ
jgi:hypothetical protein